MKKQWFLWAAVCCILLSIGVSAIRGAASTGAAGGEDPEPLSLVMQRISNEPGFDGQVETLLQGGKKGVDFLTPGLVDELRKLILGRQWQRVDRFPSLTIGSLNQSVAVSLRLVGKTKATVSGYAPNIGRFALPATIKVSLDEATHEPAYADDLQTQVKQLPYGLVMGDGPDPALAPFHAESLRLALLLNRMAQNTDGNGKLTVEFAGETATAGDELMRILARHGEQVTVDDDRFFANFGHLHDRGRDVLMPFWINSQIVIPGTRRTLQLPVSHSDYELHVRGPKLNADVSFYFGIDGKAEFRTMDSLNQPWVMGRQAHIYTGERAETAIRLLSQALRVYIAAHRAHPELPFGGYYSLGVCQDASAAVEQRLEGTTTLFPITHNPAMFPSMGAEEEEFMHEFEKLPNDRLGKTPDVSRVLGALPTLDFAAISIPGLADDLSRVAAVRSEGLLQRSPSWRRRVVWAVGMMLAIAAAILVGIRARRKAKRGSLL